MYYHTLHHRKKNIFVVIVYKLLVHKEYYNAILKDSFKINDKQKIIMPKKGEYVKFKYY